MYTFYEFLFGFHIYDGFFTNRYYDLLVGKVSEQALKQQLLPVRATIVFYR